MRELALTITKKVISRQTQEALPSCTKQIRSMSMHCRPHAPRSPPRPTTLHTEQGSARMAHRGAWQRQLASQCHFRYSTASEEGQKTGDAIRAACYVFAPSKSIWPPTRVFPFTMASTHDGRNLRFEKDSMVTVVANQAWSMTHGTIVPDSS